MGGTQFDDSLLPRAFTKEASKILSTLTLGPSSGCSIISIP